MKRSLLLAAILAFSPLQMPLISAAVADPSPQPSVALDQNFLLLPAFELNEVSKASASYRVGDEILLSTNAVTLPEGSTGPLGFALPPGTQPLNDEGWEIFPKPDPAGLRIVAVPLKAGNITIPSLAIQDSAGKSIARTLPWKVEVKSAIRPDDPEPQKPADPRPAADLAFPWWAVAALVIVGLVFFGAILYWLYRWSQSRKAPVAKIVEPPKPEDEVALSALDRLESSGAIARGEFKKYYFGVSEILKSYIGARYEFDAPENTTREMLENLRQACQNELGSDQARLKVLEELFNQLDLVKFTDHIPHPNETQQIVPAARDFVRATRRKPVMVAGGPSEIR